MDDKTEQLVNKLILKNLEHAEARQEAMFIATNNRINQIIEKLVDLEERIKK